MATATDNDDNDNKYYSSNHTYTKNNNNNDNNDDNNIPLLIQSRFPIFYSSIGYYPPRRRGNHTLITVPSTISLEDLRSRIESALTEPDDLSDTGNPYGGEHIQFPEERVRWLCVHWGGQGQGAWDANEFPATTVLCEENLEAALMFLRQGRGYDFVEARVALDGIDGPVEW